LTGAQLGIPGSLVKPDKSLYSPRVSIAWSPKFKFAKNMVVRSGYGINYNTGAYSRFASKMSFQQPFAITQNNTLTDPPYSTTTCLTPQQVAAGQPGTALTLNHGFGCSTQSTQSNFGVNPNYRLGMLQVYNFGIQRTVPLGIVLNVDYTGAFASNQDILRAPNRNALGILNPTSGQFTYEDSLGYQRSNALAVNARQRMHKGISLQATYTYSHSIDDASSVGGSGNSIAQNDQDLQAEESNSSFDRRHVLNGNFVIEPPFGPNRAFFNKGNLTSHILDGFSISGTFTFASGNFATPTYGGTPQEIAAGSGNSLRPNRVPGQSIKGAGTRLLRQRVAQLHRASGYGRHQWITLADGNPWRNPQPGTAAEREQCAEHRPVRERGHSDQLTDVWAGDLGCAHALVELHRTIPVLATVAGR
jgi:hypothetical protein